MRRWGWGWGRFFIIGKGEVYDVWNLRAHCLRAVC